MVDVLRAKLEPGGSAHDAAANIEARSLTASQIEALGPGWPIELAQLVGQVTETTGSVIA